MRKIICVLIIIVNTSCQTIKVKENIFKATDSSIELGAVGESKLTIGQKNIFTVTAYSKIEEKVKLDVLIVPFTKQAIKLYHRQARFNQQQTKIDFVDSLFEKPEMISIKIIDIASMVSELNTEKNEEIFKFIKNNERNSIISSILISIPKADIDRLRQADTYYLVQTDIAKYNIALYKSGKKVELLDISHATILGYNTSKFCWFENGRGKWQIADIVEEGYSCKGNTYKKVKPRKEKSLYKM